jgi:hypothetical protein
MEDGA